MQTTVATKPEHRKADSTHFNGYDHDTLEGFKVDSLRDCHNIVSNYCRVSPGTITPETELPIYERLAYLRAVNTLNIHRLTRALEKNALQTKIDCLANRALEIHHEGRRDYWLGIRKMQEYGESRVEIDKVPIEEYEKLREVLRISGEKIREIEENKIKGVRFPFYGIRRAESAGSFDPLKVYEKIVARHIKDMTIKPRKTLGDVVELAFRGAYETLMLKRGLDAVESGASYNEASRICDEAKEVHQDRGVSFWLPFHYVMVVCDDKAYATNASKEEQNRLRELAEMSGEKLDKLERRHYKWTNTFGISLRDLDPQEETEEPKPPIHLKRSDKKGIVRV
jgi:hypothetical protein